MVVLLNKMSLLANSRKRMKTIMEYGLSRHADRVAEVSQSLPWTPKRPRQYHYITPISDSKAEKNRKKIREKPLPKKEMAKGNPKSVSNQTGATTRHAAVKRRIKKGVHQKRPKKVKVTKNFKLKVQKSLEVAGGKPHGTFHTIRYGTVRNNATNYPQGQFVAIPGKNCLPANFMATDAWGAMANVADMVHMLSVLWNEKKDEQGTRDLNSPNSLGFTSFSGTGGQIGNLPPTTWNQANNVNTAASVNANNFVFHLKTCKHTYRIKNNSPRTVVIDVYNCAPKMPTSELDSPLYQDTGPSNVATPLIKDPLTTWRAGLDTLTKQGSNLISATPLTLYQKPTSNPQFNKYFKAEVTTIVLEPGQTVTHTIQGPSDLTVNTATCWSNGYFQDIQKFSRFTMFVQRLDLVLNVADATETGRYGASTTFFGSVSYELEKLYSFTCPDNVFGRLRANIVNSSAASEFGVQSNLRQNKFFHRVYTYGTPSQVTRYDEENPLTLQNT